MRYTRGVGAMIAPTSIGVDEFDPATDNAALLQQDYQQQLAAQQAAVIAAATPPVPTSSPVMDVLMLAGLAGLGWYGWKHGWFDRFMSGMGGMTL